MGMWTIRRDCRRLLRRIDLTPPFSIGQLCQRVGELHGREIRLIPADCPTQIFGLGMPAPGAYYIIFQQRTTAAHREHIVLHEIGHLVAGHFQHDPGDGPPVAADNALGPAADARVLIAAHLQVLHRSRYDTTQEWEAEMIATTLRESVMRRERLTGPGSVPEHVRALGAALHTGSWL